MSRRIGSASESDLAFFADCVCEIWDAVVLPKVGNLKKEAFAKAVDRERLVEAVKACV